MNLNFGLWVSTGVHRGTEWMGFYRVSHSLPNPAFLNNFTTNEQLGALQTHTTDKFLFISHTTNVLLFQFRCNVFTGVTIIKEIPGSVASGTPCIISHRQIEEIKCQYHCYIITVRSVCEVMICLTTECIFSR